MSQLALHLYVVQVATSSKTEQATFRNNDNIACMLVKVDELDDMSMGMQSNYQMFRGD